ncbi:uncharacterized protein FN964_011786 isoform 2-T4 [Alca torda]
MPPGEGRGAAGWPPSRPGGASSEHPRVLGREAVERLVFSEITVILKTSCFSAGPLSRSLPPEAAVLTVSDICCPLRGVHSFLLTEWAEYNLIYFILDDCALPSHLSLFTISKSSFTPRLLHHLCLDLIKHFGLTLRRAEIFAMLEDFINLFSGRWAVPASVGSAGHANEGV